MRELLLDALDMTLQADVRRSYQAIAKKLQVSEDTVRNRIKALEKGVFRGWRVGINPSVLGLDAYFVLFNVQPPNSKKGVIEGLKSIGNTMWISNYFDDYVSAVMAFKDEQSLKEKTALISQQGITAHLRMRFPQCSVRFLSTDWAMLRILRSDPRIPLGQVAKESNVSSKTVKRRLDKMIRAKALFVLPDLNLSALAGVISTGLVITYSDSGAKPQVDHEMVSRFNEFIIAAHLSDPENGFFILVLPNLPSVEETRSSIIKITGVKEAFVRPMVEFINILDKSFSEEIELRVTSGV